MAPTWKNSAFFSCTGKTRSSLVNFSPSQRHHYRSFNDTSCTFPCNLDALPLFSPFCLTFLFGMTVPEPNQFRQHDPIPHLPNCTPKLPLRPASWTPLAFHRVAHPWLFLCRQLLHTLFASLIVLFLPFSVSVALCLLVSRVFFACQFSRNYPRQFFRGGEFLYSGFTFSHYDLTFPTRYCIPCVRSGLYQLVISVKGFRLCALHCVCAWPRLRIAFGFVHQHGHHALRESSCVSLAHGPRWLFLLSR